MSKPPEYVAFVRRLTPAGTTDTMMKIVKPEMTVEELMGWAEQVSKNCYCDDLRIVPTKG